MRAYGAFREPRKGDDLIDRPLTSMWAGSARINLPGRAPWSNYWLHDTANVDNSVEKDQFGREKVEKTLAIRPDSSEQPLRKFGRSPMI